MFDIDGEIKVYVLIVLSKGEVARSIFAGGTIISHK